MTHITEKNINETISRYTDETGVMPKYLCGKYSALCQIANMCGFFNDFSGDGAYLTALGPVKLRLDHEAREIYVTDDKPMIGMTVIRKNSDNMEAVEDGDIVDYAAMQHHYKECLEHGLTLRQAINLMEEINGS